MSCYTYSDVYNKLNFETAILIFIKKNGSLRIMLATRNSQTIQLWGSNSLAMLHGHERRCNIKNNTIAVVDLEIDQARSFNAFYLVDYRSLGVISTIPQLLQALDIFKEFRTRYMQMLKDRQEEQEDNISNNFFDGFKLSE